MNPIARYAILAGAALTGLLIWWVLTEFTPLEAPWPFAIAILFVMADIIALRVLMARGGR